MAQYRPTQELEIPSPCSQDWDAMTGDARVRHCVSCDHDVINTANLTSSQLEALLSAPGPLPCIRMVRFDDGSLLVANEQRSATPYLRAAAIAAAALVTISGLGCSAQMTMGKMVAPRATATGQVLDVDGKPIPKAEVSISPAHAAGKADHQTVITDDSGSFRITLPPGTYGLSVQRPGTQNTPSLSASETVTLATGESSVPPLKLAPVRVFMGAPVPLRPAVKSTTKP